MPANAPMPVPATPSRWMRRTEAPSTVERTTPLSAGVDGVVMREEYPVRRLRRLRRARGLQRRSAGMPSPTPDAAPTRPASSAAALTLAALAGVAAVYLAREVLVPAALALLLVALL